MVVIRKVPCCPVGSFLLFAVGGVGTVGMGGVGSFLVGFVLRV